jgi:hypothetical protein
MFDLGKTKEKLIQNELNLKDKENEYYKLKLILDSSNKDT